MPVLNTADGGTWWLSDDEYRRRFAELRSYTRPTVSQRAELECFNEHERARTRIAALAGNSRSHMPGTDLASGYSRAQERHRDGQPDTGPGDWSADPRLNSIMSKHPDTIIRQARDHIERSHSRSAIPDRAAMVLDHGLRTGPEHERVGLASYITATGSEVYQQALARALLDPFGVNFMPDNEKRAVIEAREARRRAGLLEGTPAAWSPGSYPVPYQLDPTVTLTSSGAINPLRKIARTEQIVGKEWLGVTSAGVTVSRASEATETGDDSPTLVQPAVAPTRVQAFVPFSVEVEQDWNGLMAEIAMMVSDAKDVEEATSFLTGSGTAPEPSGLLTTLGTAETVTSASAGAIDLADIQKTERTVYPRFRAASSWIGSLDALQYGRSHEVVTTRPIVVDTPDGSTLLSKPVYELSSMDGITSGGYPLIVGDFKQLLIADRIGMSIELVPHLFGSSSRFPTGQRGIYAMWRNSSAVLTVNAFATLKVQ